MTASLTVNCPSAAYMNSYYPPFCLPACHFFLLLQHNMPFFLKLLLLPLFFSHFSNQSLSVFHSYQRCQLQPCLLLNIYSSFSSSALTFSSSLWSKFGDRLRSCSLFELETAPSPLLMFPPTTLSHLSSSSTRPIFPVCFSVSSPACLMFLSSVGC